MPSTNFTALRVRRDILANSDIGVMFLNKEDDGPHYNRVAGVDANFRFGFLNAERATRAKTFSPQRPIARQRRGLRGPRRSANYQSRTWQFRGPLQRDRRAVQRRDGIRARAGASNNALLYVGRAVPPRVAVEIGIREIAAALADRRRSRGATAAASSRATRTGTCRSISTTARSSRSASTRTSRRSASRSPSTARAASASKPGRYEFNEWFALWSTNTAAPFSFDSRYSIGEFYDGYRRGYTFGPRVRVNEHFNASVSLQINDIDLSTGSFVSKLVTEPRQLQLQHEDVRQRAAAVQHRHRGSGARTCGSTSSTGRSATSSSSTTSAATSAAAT